MAALEKNDKEELAAAQELQDQLSVHLEKQTTVKQLEEHVQRWGNNTVGWGVCCLQRLGGNHGIDTLILSDTPAFDVVTSCCLSGIATHSFGLSDNKTYIFS